MRYTKYLLWRILTMAILTMAILTGAVAEEEREVGGVVVQRQQEGLSGPG